MNDYESSCALAVVLGWEKESSEGRYWSDKNHNVKFYVTDDYADDYDSPGWYFHPFDNDEQAIMCLNIWHSMSTCHISTIHRNGSQYVVTLDDGLITLSIYKSKSLSRAISNAVYIALLYEDKFYEDAK